MQIAHLVLGRLDSSICDVAVESKLPGSETLHILQSLVYGSELAAISTNKDFVSFCVLNGTFEQAERYGFLLRLTLEKSLTCNNCLFILRLADAIGKGCEKLYSKAFNFTVSNFVSVMESNARAWELLPQRLVLRCLSSDALAIDSEIDVSRALIAWTCADMKNRQSSFLYLFTKCVRLALMSYDQLRNLMDDDYDLGAINHSVPKLVYFSFIKICMGEEVPTEWEENTLNYNPRSRRDKSNEKSFSPIDKFSRQGAERDSVDTIKSLMLESPTKSMSFKKSDLNGKSKNVMLDCRNNATGVARALQW